MATDECFYHGNRVQFDVLTKALKQCLVIPKTYLNRLAMAVCSCRKNRQDLSKIITEENLRCIVKFFDENFLNHEGFSSTLKECITDLLNRTHSIEQYGPAKSLYILYQAVQNKTYEQLSYDATNTRPKPKSTIDANSPKKTIKMNAKQFECMKRKKLRRKNMVYKLNVPMFAGNVRRLQVSCNEKMLKKKFGRGLFMWYDYDANTKHMTNNEKLTEIILYCENKQILKDVQSLLKRSAAQIQETEDAAREMRKRWRAMFYPSRITYTEDGEDEYSFTELACRTKESSRSEFKKKRIRRSSKKKTPPLEGGHCLNCLAEFTGDLHNSHIVCRHHPGFIVEKKTSKTGEEYKWSCCEEDSEEKTATHDSHKSNGCVSDIHNWRRGKNLQYKNKGDVYIDGEKGFRHRKNEEMIV